ncbi:hypothetical protein [Tardiphaga sp. OK245]|uniref:hypothetical protein n=1 Tax=Tardiphaga sp. OK245 TaxID=1855306 RepID=UPI0008A7DD9B|nr:hypothetical protein [Tardiphaga sp. OK245]SEH40090.1 hypothetical protein SAMN05216367_0018 [Tardiphaga sp. OK245]
MDLDQQFREFLVEAERMFGAPNRSFVLDSIRYVDYEFTPNRIMFALDDHIEIQLSKSAKRDHDKTLAQLSHETVHTLWPVKVHETHIIEEGAATYFSMVVPKYIDATYLDRTRAGLVGEYAAYARAENDVRTLLSINPDAIRAARRGRSFCEITAEELLAVAPSLDPETARRMITVFSL